MRKSKLPLNPFGAVGGAVRRSPLGAGEQRVLLPFSRWKKVVAAAACTKGSWFWPRGQTTPKICENMAADNRQHPISRYRAATSFCQQTKGRKNCFSHLCSRGKRNRKRFPRRGSHEQQISGWPRAFASYRITVYMEHSVRALSGEDRSAQAGGMRPPLASA